MTSPAIFAIPRSELGGAQRSLLLLLRALDRKEFPPRVLLGEDGPLARSLRELDVPFEVAQASFRSLGGIGHFTKYAIGARILHLYGARTLALVARARGLAVVERVNLLRGKEAGGLVARPFLDRTLLRLAHRVIVPSAAMLDQLVERGVPREKLRLVPNGVFLPAPSAPRAELRARLGVPEGTLLVLGIGRLVPVKGWDLLLRALPSVVGQLLLAGEGPERAALLEVARTAAVLDRVKLLGDREDVADLLEASDVVVQASRSEVLSNSVLEALLAGRAVVATDVGGTAEVIENDRTGLLVAPSIEGIAAGLQRVAGDAALRERLGRAGQERVTAERSLVSMGRATEQVYREALAETGS